MFVRSVSFCYVRVHTLCLAVWSSSHPACLVLLPTPVAAVCAYAIPTAWFILFSDCRHCVSFLPCLAFLFLFALFLTRHPNSRIVAARPCILQAISLPTCILYVPLTYCLRSHNLCPSPTCHNACSFSFLHPIPCSEYSKGKSQVIKAHPAPVRSVVFSRDSRSILTASDDKTCKVCDCVCYLPSFHIITIYVTFVSGTVCSNAAFIVFCHGVVPFAFAILYSEVC